jgi:hypothetical protein
MKVAKMALLDNLQNEYWNKAFFENSTTNKLFICAIGYEQRSTHLLTQTLDQLTPHQVLCIFFPDFEQHTHSKDLYTLLTKRGFNTPIVEYSNFNKFMQLISDELIKLLIIDTKIELHIDYSSMPRNWYCRITLLLIDKLRKIDKAFFWYSEGKYLTDGERFPSAGVNDFTVFSGKCSLSSNGHRSHIFGLGYDHIRSQAILSVIDPNYLVVCFAYPPNKKEVSEKIKNANQDIISSAIFTFALPIDDFVYVISKVNDTSRELLNKGDVVLVPDGPKPLILAISLIPNIINKEGIVCLHISRHQSDFMPIDVTATGIIYGFSFQGNTNESR